MATTPTQFKATGYVPSTAAAQYTVPTSTTAIVKQISLHNTSSSPVQVTLNAVASGGSASTANQKTKITLAALQSVQLHDWINLTLPASSAIYAVAATASVVTIDISGNEVT